MMEYIKQMRKLIGHTPLLLVGAAVLVVQDGRLLMLRRSDNGSWGIPGGALEPGERLEETARRETLEETGLELGELALLGVFSGPELFYRYPNGNEVHNVSVVYQTGAFRGEVRLNDEHTEYRFFEISQLPEDVSPPVRVVLQRLQELHC